MSRDNPESISHIPEDLETQVEKAKRGEEISGRELEKKYEDANKRIEAELQDLYKTDVGKRIKELEELRRERVARESED